MSPLIQSGRFGRWRGPAALPLPRFRPASDTVSGVRLRLNAWSSEVLVAALLGQSAVKLARGSGEVDPRRASEVGSRLRGLGAPEWVTRGVLGAPRSRLVDGGIGARLSPKVGPPRAAFGAPGRAPSAVKSGRVSALRLSGWCPKLRTAVRGSRAPGWSVGGSVESKFGARWSLGAGSLHAARGGQPVVKLRVVLPSRFLLRGLSIARSWGWVGAVSGRRMSRRAAKPGEGSVVVGCPRPVNFMRP